MHQALTPPPTALQVAKKRRSRRKRYIVLGSTGLLLLLVIVSVVMSKREKPIPITTEKAVRKTILQTVSATGKVQPETEVKISPEVAGEIIELPVEDGMQVKKNDLLVKIKPDSYKALLEQQEAAISAAKTTIYAPMDGTVTILNSKLGERLVATNQFAGTEVMRVADLSHMQAVVDVNENDVVNVKLGDKANIKIDAYGDRKFKGVVQQIANTGKTTGAGTQEEVTNFEVKIRVDDHDVALRPGLSCTADIQTNMVNDAVAVQMQSVTIRTGDTNLSPEEIEKQKQKIAARDKDDNKAELSNDHLEKQAQKEERE